MRGSPTLSGSFGPSSAFRATLSLQTGRRKTHPAINSVHFWFSQSDFDV
jgi:hypothetical protein